MEIKHYFFGREVNIDRGLENRESLDINLTKKGFVTNKTLLLNQIHSNKVCVIDSSSKIYANKNLPKADSIITNQKNVNIAVITADCAPILLFCKKANIIAAAHAGWKGARSGIIKNTILAMKNLGAIDVEAIIGPMIQQYSYEVSKGFYQDFLSDNSQNKDFFISGKISDKFQFDLNSYVENELRKSDVMNIKNSKTDTYINDIQYFSYRRSTHENIKDCGRNMSVISMQE